MRTLSYSLLVASAVLVAQTSSVAPARADDFYKGKTLTLVVGSHAGGGYDANTRLLGRHYPRHIPGEPNTVVQNMPGASGLKALNYMYNIAPGDGSVIGAAANTVPLDPLFDGPAARFDALKMNWLGSISKQLNVCFAWHDSGFRTIQDAQEKRMRVSATGATGWRAFLPNLFNAVGGTKFQVIKGYDSSGSMMAVEKGEVEGMCADYATLLSRQNHWLEKKQIVFLAQFGLKPGPDLSGVPMGMDLVSDPVDRRALQLFLTQQEFGRPFVAPPEVPADRVAMLRAAFDATMADPEFRAEAKKLRIWVEPLTGAEMDSLLQDAYASDPEVVQRTKVLLKRATGADNG